MPLPNFEPKQESSQDISTSILVFASVGMVSDGTAGWIDVNWKNMPARSIPLYKIWYYLDLRLRQSAHQSSSNNAINRLSISHVFCFRGKRCVISQRHVMCCCNLFCRVRTPKPYQVFSYISISHSVFDTKNLHVIPTHGTRSTQKERLHKIVGVLQAVSDGSPFFYEEPIISCLCLSINVFMIVFR